LKEKELIKEIEKDKRNAEKEKKKMDRQIQKEKTKSVRFSLLKEEQCTFKILRDVMLEILILKFIQIGCVYGFSSFDTCNFMCYV
jgi:Tfp pilus assembly pilus retraction ATPase PilT